MSGKGKKKKNSRRKRKENRERILKKMQTLPAQEASATKAPEEKEDKNQQPLITTPAAETVVTTESSRIISENLDASKDDEKKGLRHLSWKKLRGRQKVGIMAAAALGVAAVAYVSVAWQYRDKLLPGTTVNQIACGELTLTDTEEEIREQVEDYSVTLQLRDGQTAEITADMIGYHYVPDDGVSEILREQNIFLWFPALFSTREYQVEENIDFDRELLSQFIDELPQTQADQETVPVDAQLIYQEGGFVIQPETEGNQLKIEELKKTLEQAMLDGKTEVSAETAGLYEEPAVRQDNELLLAQKEQLNQLANASITYQMPGDETLVLDGNTLRGWLLQDEAGNYYRDDAFYQQCLDAFVKDLENRIDNVGSARTFKSTNYGEYTLSGGSYGWMLSRAKEREQLKNDLAAGGVLTREPVYRQKGIDSLENGGIGNTYVEIDMSNQHMWFYKDGECVLDSDVVTGTMVRSRYTPEGIYYLYFKQRNRVLRGQIVPSTGKPEYETPVAYWMPFNGGIGLHDADWNSYFGGKKYIYSGSHGCINLPSRVAGKLYSMIEVGTPVICYYPEGYSLHG